MPSDTSRRVVAGGTFRRLKITEARLPSIGPIHSQRVDPRRKETEAVKWDAIVLIG